MNYFIDTEFIEDGIILDLLSIGIISEDGKEMYLLNSGARIMRADSWVKNNVLKYLPGITITDKGDIQCDEKYPNPMFGWVSIHGIMLQIIELVNGDNKPVFWADYGAYDWVAFARCFGRLIDLPKEFPMYVKDFQMLLDICGNPNLPQLRNKNNIEHKAIDDARHLKMQFEYINKRFEITVDDHENKSVFTAEL